MAEFSRKLIVPNKNDNFWIFFLNIKKNEVTKRFLSTVLKLGYSFKKKNTQKWVFYSKILLKNTFEKIYSEKLDYYSDFFQLKNEGMVYEMI